VHDVAQWIWLDQAKFDEEVVGSTQGELIVLLIRVVVKESVASVLEFHELAIISAFAVTFYEFFGGGLFEEGYLRG